MRDVGVGTRASEEDARVLGRDTRCPAHHCKANDGDHGVGGDDRATDAILIGYPRCSEHAETGEGVCEVSSVTGLRLLGLGVMFGDGRTYMVEQQDTAPHRC